MDKEKDITTPGEQKAEEENLAEVEEDEVRAKVIDELGLDEYADQEIIDKVVKKEVAHRQKLSEAIRQKISWREKANATPKDASKETPKEADEDVQAKVLNILEEQRLEDMVLPEALKEEVKNLAKLKGISVKKAAEDPYILFKKQELDAEAKAEDATISRTKKATPTKFDAETVPKFDLSTPEGQKGWEDYKRFLQNQDKK